MNKQTFIGLLKAPDDVSETNFKELESLIKEYPYCHSAHAIAARSSRTLKKASAAKKMNTAAIYATNRNVLKKYVLGQLKSKLAQPTQQTITKSAPAPKPTSSKTTVAPRKAPQHLSRDEQSELIKEIYENLDRWKHSRDHYLDFDRAHPEDIIIDAPPMQEDTVSALKSQIAEEVIKEEAASMEVVEKTDEPVLEDTPVSKQEEATPIETTPPDDEKTVPIITDEMLGEEKIPDTPEEIAKRAREAGLSEDEIEDLLATVKEEESTTTDKIEKESETSDTVATQLDAIDGSDLAEVKEISLEDFVEGVETKETPEVADESKPSASKPASIEDSIEEDSKDTPSDREQDEATVPKSEPILEPENISLNTAADSDQSTEDTEMELDKLDKEKQSLKLTLDKTGEGTKKFRLSFIKPTSIKGKGAEAKPSSATKTLTKKKSEAKKPTTDKDNSESSEKKKSIEVKHEQKPDQDNLIEQFLKTSPSIEVNKNPDQDQPIEDLSLKSVQPHEDTSTENLARIMQDQGKNSQAITIYEKLIVKYPKNKKGYQLKIKELSSDKKAPSTKTPEEKLFEGFMASNPTLLVVNWQDVVEVVEDAMTSENKIDASLISENTADILIHLNDHKGAVFIYEKLILKLPEKKAYFADQIQKIKNT